MNNQTSTPQNSRSNLPGWDLKDLYSGIDDPQIKKDLEEYRRLNQKLADNYKGKIADILPADFYEALQIEEQSSIIGSKLGVYAYLNMVTQMKNTEALAFYQNIDEKMTEYSKPSIFFTLEINKLSEPQFAKLAADEKVAYYKPFLERVRRFQAHELPEEQEAIFLDKSVTSFI